MDRFIADHSEPLPRIKYNLKSNMDRFIGVYVRATGNPGGDLKSNMDRFIAKPRRLR